MAEPCVPERWMPEPDGFGRVAADDSRGRWGFRGFRGMALALASAGWKLSFRISVTHFA